MPAHNTTIRRPGTPAPTTDPSDPSPFLVIHALDPDALNEMDNGEYTATVGACGLLRDDGSPSQEGDVLSVQPDGTLQTRPGGTSGSYERLCKTGAGAVYRPAGKGSLTVIIPLAQDAPNK
jgi:hypothetical protein